RGGDGVASATRKARWTSRGARRAAGGGEEVRGPCGSRKYRGSGPAGRPGGQAHAVENPATPAARPSNTKALTLASTGRIEHAAIAFGCGDTRECPSVDGRGATSSGRCHALPGFRTR